MIVFRALPFLALAAAMSPREGTADGTVVAGGTAAIARPENHDPPRLLRGRSLPDDSGDQVANEQAHDANAGDRGLGFKYFNDFCSETRVFGGFCKDFCGPGRHLSYDRTKGHCSLQGGDDCRSFDQSHCNLDDPTYYEAQQRICNHHCTRGIAAAGMQNCQRTTTSVNGVSGWWCNYYVEPFPYDDRDNHLHYICPDLPEYEPSENCTCVIHMTKSTDDYDESRTCKDCSVKDDENNNPTDGYWWVNWDCSNVPNKTDPVTSNIKAAICCSDWNSAIGFLPDTCERARDFAEPLVEGKLLKVYSPYSYCDCIIDEPDTSVFYLGEVDGMLEFDTGSDNIADIRIDSDSGLRYKKVEVDSCTECYLNCYSSTSYIVFEVDEADEARGTPPDDEPEEPVCGNGVDELRLGDACTDDGTCTCPHPTDTSIVQDGENYGCFISGNNEYDSHCCISELAPCVQMNDTVNYPNDGCCDSKCNLVGSEYKCCLATGQISSHELVECCSDTAGFAPANSTCVEGATRERKLERRQRRKKEN